jgi:uncharacterized repeat protein (TIGR02543 family)
MGKGAKIIGTLFLVLGIACIALYFVMGDKFSNHKVVFDSKGGTAITEQIVKKGEKAVKPVDPVKENSDFIEWQLGGVAYNFNSVVDKDITLVAAWNEFVNRVVKVNLEGNDYTTNVRDGQTVNLDALNLPSKDGYYIKFTNENNEEVNINNPVTSDMNLTAQYVQIVTYTVKFNSNGGSKVDDVKVNEGTTVTEPTSTRDGYILDGWYLGEQKFDFSTPITKDITLKARWNDGPKINVIFKVDDTVYKTVPTKENTTVSKPSNPTKKGYRFVEWQLDGNAFDFKTKITAEITLTAKFEEVTTAKVTFNKDNGSSNEVKTVNVGDKVSKPSDPKKSGYKFKEWQLNGKAFDFNTAITEDITLKAIYEQEKAKYTVTFRNDDNTEIATKTVEEGSKVTKPTDPTKDGYRFIEWVYNHAAFNFDTPITQNIVLTARYEKINADVVEPTNPQE